MESTSIEYHPLKLKLDIKHKMLMLNICSVNDVSVNVSGRSCGPSPYIFDIYYISFFIRPQFERNWLRKLRTIALPVYFMVLNFDYGIQLSIIHVSKYCLMPVTFYSLVVILLY